MKWLIACAIMVVGACYIEYVRNHRSFHFFGAQVDSDYVMHFDNKMRCAYVIGWYSERKCLCFLTEDDPRLKDKTLIASEPSACNKDLRNFDAINPE